MNFLVQSRTRRFGTGAQHISRAKELIKQILTVSRFAQEQQRIPTDISSIIKEALKLLRSSLPTSIEMRQKIRKCLALADPTQIHQVLMNLCTNAAHAMDGKGILEVDLSTVDLRDSDLTGWSIVDLKPGPYVKLCVSDTGSGMDKATWIVFSILTSPPRTWERKRPGACCR